MPFVYCTIAPGDGHALRHPGSSQCMQPSLRISHSRSPSVFSYSEKRMTVHECSDRSVGYTHARLEALSEGSRKGLRLTFEDQGKGIPDLDLALTDGYTTGTGLGLGLSGSKRLMSEFEVVSRVGEGTRVTVTQWK